MSYEIGDKVELTNGNIVEIIDYANSIDKTKAYVVSGNFIISQDKIVKKIV